MAAALGYRALVFVVGGLVGVGVPILALGAYVLHGLPLEYASRTEIVVAGVCAVLGAWLVVVSLFAEQSTVETVVASFQQPDAVFLVVPVVVYVMTRSVWRRLKGR